MASDLSNIFKEELSNTLEQLLSKSSQIEAIVALVSENFDSTQLVECVVKFDFKGISSKISFYIPTLTATKFEYLMLGGMGDLKEHIDDEITDAVNEIISNICGSFCTSVNAQGLPDIGSIKSEVKSSTIVEGSSLENKTNIFEMILSLDDEKLPIILYFDEIISPFFSSITGVEGDGNDSSGIVRRRAHRPHSRRQSGTPARRRCRRCRPMPGCASRKTTTASRPLPRTTTAARTCFRLRARSRRSSCSPPCCAASA